VAVALARFTGSSQSSHISDAFRHGIGRAMLDASDVNQSSVSIGSDSINGLAHRGFYVCQWQMPRVRVLAARGIGFSGPLVSRSLKMWRAT
jgi:hypothetical protein